jgi:hypothetical protein
MNLRTPVMASRRSTPPTRARAKTGGDKLPSPVIGIERLQHASAVVHEALPLEQQLEQVLEAAREVVAVDRLLLWAVAGESDRLVHVTSSGLSKEDRRSLGERLEIPLAQAGAMARAYREKMSLVVDATHPLDRESL